MQKLGAAPTKVVSSLKPSYRLGALAAVLLGVGALFACSSTDKTKAVVRNNSIPEEKKVSMMQAVSPAITVRRATPVIEGQEFSEISLTTKELKNNPDRVIKFGDSCDAILDFSRVLDLPYVTRCYDNRVAAAVGDFQRKHRQKPSGVIDKNTTKLLLSLLKSTGDGKRFVPSKKYAETFDYDPVHCLLALERFGHFQKFNKNACWLENVFSPGELKKMVASALTFQPAEYIGFYEYLEDLQAALDFGIKPFMLTKENLREVVARYKEPRLSDSALLLVAKEDHNAAFYNKNGFNNLVRDLLGMGLNVRFATIANDFDLETKPVESLLRDSKDLPVKAMFLALCFHGFEDGLSTQSGNQPSYKIDIYEKYLKALHLVVHEKGTTLAYACKGAYGGRFNKNVVARLHEDTKTTSVGPEEVCNMMVGKETCRTFFADGQEAILVPVRKSANPALRNGFLHIGFYHVGLKAGYRIEDGFRVHLLEQVPAVVSERGVVHQAVSP